MELILKFMTSQPRWHTIIIHTMSNISRNKNSRTMKFGRLIEYKQRKIFIQKIFTKWGRWTRTRPPFVFQNSFISCKSKWCVTWFQHTSIALNLAYSKNKLYKTLDYWFRNILNFNFLEKDIGIVSPPHFVYDFSRNIFLKLYSIN